MSASGAHEPLGSVYTLLGIPKDLFTPVFAASRVAGWTAHVLEEYQDLRLIRPTARYVGPVHELGPDRLLAVGEGDLGPEHLRDQVPVGELPLPLGPGPGGIDPDPDRLDVRLQPDGVLDRPGEPSRGPRADRRPEVLVEDAPELDPGLEEQRLAARQRHGVEVGRSGGHGGAPGAASGLGAGTVNGPTT